MKPSFLLLLIPMITFLSCGEQVLKDPTFCPCIKESDLNTTANKGPKFTFSYVNPLLLPFKLKFNTEDGLFIEDDVHELVTPIGVFGVEYSVPMTDEARTVGGTIVPKGSYIVALVNRKKKTKQLFAIKDMNKLNITTEGGETRMEFQIGYAEVDVTNTKIRDLKFFDGSKVAIQNDTEKALDYLIKVYSVWYTCTIAPKETKFFPIDMYELPETSVKIITDNVANNQLIESTKSSVGGDVCILYWDDQREIFDIRKKI